MAASLDKIAKALEAVGNAYNHMVAEVTKFKNVVEELKKKVVDSIDSFAETFTEILGSPLATLLAWVTAGATWAAVIIAFVSKILKSFRSSKNSTDENDKGKDTSEKREDEDTPVERRESHAGKTHRRFQPTLRR